MSVWAPRVAVHANRIVFTITIPSNFGNECVDAPSPVIAGDVFQMIPDTHGCHYP